MKKFTIILLLICILTINSGILPAYAAVVGDWNAANYRADNSAAAQDHNYSGLNDSALHQYIRDNIYATLENEFEGDNLIIEEISTTYVSKEYIEEFDYNSKANVFFGYTLAELDEQFKGQKYVFTLGDDGQTTVEPFETIDHSEVYNSIIKNVLIGSGVILISVAGTLILSGGATAPIGMIFAASAAKSATMALQSAAVGGLFKGISAGVLTGDFDEALRQAALGASEGFKMGAIVGTLVGGVEQAYSLFSASKIAASSIPTPRESELRATEIYGGNEQVSYLGGQEVSQFTQNATRPDIVRQLPNGSYEAIEVKNYNLIDNLDQLVNTLVGQIQQRVTDLPAGYSQRVVLDVAGRGYSDEVINAAISEIKVACASFYPDLPVDVMPW